MINGCKIPDDIDWMRERDVFFILAHSHEKNFLWHQKLLAQSKRPEKIQSISFDGRRLLLINISHKSDAM